MSRARAAVLLLAVLAGALFAAPAAAETRPDGTMRLTGQTPWVSKGGQFSLHLAFDDLEAPERLDLAITLHQRTGSRSAFTRSIERRPQFTLKAYTPISIGLLATEADGDRVATLSAPAAGVPATPFTLPSNLQRGVYPVTVALRVHGGAVVDSFVTHLVRLPDDAELTPLAVAWVQPIGAAPALHADGSRSLDPDDALALSRTIRSVADHAAVPLTLAVTPETTSALDEEQLASLRTAAAGDQVLAAPYVDVDPAALTAAGVDDDLVAQRQLGADALDAAIGERGDPRTWASARPLTASTLDRLRSLGIERVVVPEASLEPLDADITDSLTLTRPFSLATGRGDVVQAAAVDTGLLAHFRTRGDDVLAAHRLLADLAVLFFDLPGSARGVAVQPPDGNRPSGAFLDEVLGGLATSPILRPVTLDQFFDQVDPLVSRRDPVVREVTDRARSSSLPARRLDDAHRALDQFVSLVGPGAEAVPALRARLLVAEATRLSAAERNALLGAVVAARDDVRDRLELPDQRTFRLTARKGTIPLTISNGSPFHVRVQLVLSSDKLEFTQVHGGDRSRQVLADLDLAPGTRTLTIPVQARASGTFNLRASLLTVDGTELRRSRLTIRSTVFSGVGVVLSIGAGLFLALWWAKHWRTSRRARVLVEAP